jgi:transcriptional regulator with XRE-family HTH domain
MPQKKRSTAPASAPIGSNLQRLRLQRGLSIPELAQHAGVSEPMLADVEAGSLSPSIKLLWSIATALRVPFGTLVQSASERALPNLRAVPPTARELERASESPNEQPRTSSVARRSLLPTAAQPGRRTEVHEVKLGARSSESAALYPHGTRETVLVTAGSVIVQTELEQHELRTGESVELDGDRERSYRNPGESRAVLYIMVAPQRAD